MKRAFAEWKEKQESTDESASMRVIEVDDGLGLEIREFEYKDLSQSAPQDYHQVKSRLGPLAVTDPEIAKRGAKDRRFSLNPYTKKSLSIHHEELRVMESLVKEQIQGQVKQAKEHAHQLGYDEGYAQGLEKGLQEFKAQNGDQLAKIEEFLRQAEAAKIDVFRANEKFLVQLVYRLARLILLKELKEDRAHLGRLIEQLIRETRAKEYIIVRVNPQDLEAISLIKPDLKASFNQLNNIKLESCAEVPVGGCQIETEWTQIETDVNLQLKSIEHALLGGGA